MQKPVEYLYNKYVEKFTEKEEAPSNKISDDVKPKAKKKIVKKDK